MDDRSKEVVIILLFAICIFTFGIFINNQPTKCGMCGAHVHDWWKIRNMSDTEFVNVCEYCYLDAMKD